MDKNRITRSWLAGNGFRTALRRPGTASSLYLINFTFSQTEDALQVAWNMANMFYVYFKF
jgi:hypothetical protein